MEDQISNLILTEIRDMRRDMSDGFSDLKQRTTAIETTITPFFANDGEKKQMQNEIDKLRQTKWYGLGFIGAVSLVGHYVAHKLGL